MPVNIRNIGQDLIPREMIAAYATLRADLKRVCLCCHWSRVRKLTRDRRPWEGFVQPGSC